MKKINGIPHDFFLFSGLTDEEFKCAEKLSEFYVQEFDSKEEIFSPTDYKSSIGYIIRGSVRVYKLSMGHSTMLNNIPEKGCFGVAGIFIKDPEYMTTVIATEKTQIMFIDAIPLKTLIRTYPAVALNYIYFLSEKIRFLNNKIDGFTKGNAEGKVAKFLLDEMKKHSSNTVLIKNMSKAANFIGIARASLYRIMDSMSDKGVISYNQSEIKILNTNYLERLQ